MAKYTMTYNDMITNIEDYPRLTEVLDSFPVWREDFRKVITDSMRKQLKFDEIGLETPELFIEYLEQFFDENMPYYNELYKYQELREGLDPLLITRAINQYKELTNDNQRTKSNQTQKATGNTLNNDIGKTKSTGENESNTNGVSSAKTQNTSNSNSVDNNFSNTKNNDKSLELNSEFPQGNIGAGTGAGLLEDSGYWTSGKKNTGENNTASNGQSVSNSNDKSASESNNLNNQYNKGSQTNQSENYTNSVSNSKNTLDSDILGSLNKQGQKLNDGENKVFGDVEQLEKFMKSYVNITLKLIKQLRKELFMTIY